MKTWNQIFALTILLAFLSSCATTTSKRSRMMTAAGIGGTAGSVGGALFSPNRESRGLNTLVFGLVGALLGGLIGAWTEPGSGETPTAPSETLKEKELSSPGDSREFTVPPQGDLPGFLKDRVQPAIVEEFIETDMVGEDGTLHEPHRVYRIKRPAELISRPAPNPTSSPGGKP